ncbi:type II toxin-antitoxin system PemK/MazF family toxin [Candidatus Pacearchaeota archaeon]|nr:type II toxin-antitoxin system PemK/MazF family toxin [Candidatus Pacearchaeota archaeon]
MKLKRFDIVLVDFPFSDLKKTKKRPAMVINSLEGENSILCQITTKNRKIKKYEIQLKKEYCEGEIQFDSLIYVDMIFTLHKSLIYRKIGEIKDIQTKEEINNKIKLTLK